MSSELDRTQTLVRLAAGALGASAVITQLVLVREFLTVYAGNELSLGIVLGNWLLLSGLGASCGAHAPRLRDPPRTLIVGLLFLALAPIAQVGGLRTLWHVFFTRGAALGLTETVVSSLALLLPYCALGGYLLTVACAILSARVGPSGVGRVYVADAIGSVLGGLIFVLVLAKALDHLAVLSLSAILLLVCAGLLAHRTRKTILLTLNSVVGAGLIALFSLGDPDAFTVARQFAPQQIVFRGHSPYGRLVVTEVAGQLNFIENGVPIAWTRDPGRAEETVHYAMAQRPDAVEVLLVSGALSGTAAEILKYPRAQLTCVELDPLVIQAGRRFVPESVAHDRLRIINTDGRRFVQRTSQRFDVVIVDLPEPSTSQLNRFYTAEFFTEITGVLRPEGVLSFGLGRYENYVSPELARLLSCCHKTLRQRFAHILMIPGGRVFFLASQGSLHADIVERVDRSPAPRQLVKRAYLEAMLAPDRMADLHRAVAASAKVNHDFNPVLYFYHLRHWLSQFDLRLGLLVAVPAVALAIYAIRLRPVTWVVFASGFGASTLEIVLLLAFQVLYGSVYYHVGLIVSAFMLGLAAGAWFGNRLPSTQARPRFLGAVAMALALVAALVPLLGLLSWVGGRSPAVVIVGQMFIFLFTFAIATLAGAEFPVATQLESARTGNPSAPLYTADYVGACVGAVLSSAILIPLVGVITVCLIAAALNGLAGGALLMRKASL